MSSLFIYLTNPLGPSPPYHYTRVVVGSISPSEGPVVGEGSWRHPSVRSQSRPPDDKSDVLPKGPSVVPSCKSPPLLGIKWTTEGDTEGHL